VESSGFSPWHLFLGCLQQFLLIRVAISFSLTMRQIAFLGAQPGRRRCVARPDGDVVRGRRKAELGFRAGEQDWLRNGFGTDAQLTVHIAEARRRRHRNDYRASATFRMARADDLCPGRFSALAIARGSQMIELTVRGDNPARKLYRQMRLPVWRLWQTLRPNDKCSWHERFDFRRISRIDFRRSYSRPCLTCSRWGCSPW